MWAKVVVVAMAVIGVLTSFVALAKYMQGEGEDENGWESSPIGNKMAIAGLIFGLLLAISSFVLMLLGIEIK